MEIGTLVTNGTRKMKPGVNDTVAVPLYVVVIPFFVGLPVILKSAIVCICGEVPLNITILNLALKAGELELIFLNSDALRLRCTLQDIIATDVLKICRRILEAIKPMEIIRYQIKDMALS
jgi:hypothetical protein